MPTADANIEILPSEGEGGQIGESDLKISYAQAIPFRLNVGLEDSGSTSTGKWQASATLSWDNILYAQYRLPSPPYADAEPRLPYYRQNF